MCSSNRNKKRTQSDKTYNITVNVYNPNTNIPETIESTEITSKLYIRNNGYKLVKYQ